MSKLWKPAKSNFESGIEGLSLDEVGDATKIVSSKVHHSSHSSGLVEEPVIQPIVHSASYLIQSVQHYSDILKEGGYIYVRLNNPTCEAAECAIRVMEGGAGSVVFGSGMAAISTVLFNFLKAGDHVVACRSLYSGTFELLKKHLAAFNVESTFVGFDVEEYRKAIKPNTKLLYTESPSNPLVTVVDLEAFGKLGRSLEGVVTVVDSTCATPYLIKPIQYGIDIVLHSGTKYLGGHSDLCAGVVTTRTEDQWRTVFLGRRAFGGLLSPFDASLLLRGIRTLHVRMDRHCDNAEKVAEYLNSHPKIEKVHYPGLKDDESHEVAKKQMKRFGAMIAFDVRGGLEPAKTFIQNLHVIKLAVSLGAVESLASHPASMTHGPMIMSDAERKENSITDGQIRLSVGIEDANDLINDLRQALNKVVL